MAEECNGDRPDYPHWVFQNPAALIKETWDTGQMNSPSGVHVPDYPDQVEDRLPVKACVRCKQMKMACDNERPCRRCVRMGRDDECVDVMNKRPGRKTKLEKASSELILHPTGKFWSVFEGDVLYFDAFSNACLTLLRQIEPMFAQFFQTEMSRPTQCTTSALSEFLRTVQGVADPIPILRASFFYSTMWLSSLRAFCAENNVIMREPFYRFCCRDLLHRAPLYCVTDEEIADAQYRLGIPYFHDYLSIDRSCQWLEGLSSYLMDAPMGVLGMRYKHGTMQSVFVNDKLSELFLYSRDEFLYLILSNHEDLMMRLFYTSEWAVMFGQWIACVLGSRPSWSRKGLFVRADGVKFEAMWSVQMKYDEDRIPETMMMYITPLAPS